MVLRSTSSRIVTKPVLVAFAGCIGLASALSAQTQPIAERIDDPRPLDKGVQLIVERCRCVVTYEDPVYTPDQLVDVTAQVRRDPKATSRILGPKGTPFWFGADWPTVVRQPSDVAPTVDTLLERFHQSGNRGRFRREAGDGVLHVVPAGGSVLDVRVSIPDTEAKASALLPALVNAVSAAAGIPIGIGLAPTNHLAQATIKLAANNEPAQQVLTRLLAATGRKVSWRLFYGQLHDDVYGYMLNLSLVDPGRCIRVNQAGQCIEADQGDTLNAVYIKGR